MIRRIDKTSGRWRLAVANAPTRCVVASAVLVGVLAAVIVSIALRQGVTNASMALAIGAMTIALGIALVALLAMRRSLSAQALLMAGAHDGIFEWNPLTKELKVGLRLLAILGYADNFLQDTHAWLKIVHPDDRERYNRTVAAHLKGLTDHFYCEYRVRAHNGEYRWLAARGIALRNRQGKASQMAGSVTDITERIEREQQIRDLALNDQLTGLPNRRSLMERLPTAIETARRCGTQLAVLFIDLDRFKNVNDARGHLFGDALLVAITRRLPGALRAYDLLMRQGGDELVVVLTSLGSPAEAALVAERLLELVADPVVIDDSDIRITGSIGVAMFPADGEDADALLRCADMAMYAAKASGGNEVRFFEGEMQARVSARASMESRLRIAIENGDLVLHYQPQCRFADGKLVGAEALVRWQDGAHMIRPDQFIGLAEETGLIVPLGRWVIDSAVEQLARWQSSCVDTLRVSINLSPRQFLRHSVEMDVLAAIARHGVLASRVELEVTESVLFNPEGAALRMLNNLREAGCRVALDDFGTGYSSLSYLQSLDLDCLKIDKSFVANLAGPAGSHGARGSTAIVSAMIVLGRRLGYEVVAEGVETVEQFNWLKATGCELCQGYFFSRPLPAAEFESGFLTLRAGSSSNAAPARAF
ncbi:putative bifunctional diguanylate cyclase/phosphodiesterase [Parazoarcus communis]|nr:GGDEF domain-containing phosphodiesterase [Parazoarcus communis]